MHYVELDDSAMVTHSDRTTTLASYDTVDYFDQLIDHTNPGLVTFQKRYWHTYIYKRYGFWGAYRSVLSASIPTSAFLFSLILQVCIHRLYRTPYEPDLSWRDRAAATGRVGRLLNIAFSENLNPHSDLSGSSLEVSTIQQSIDDLEYFAQNVELPIPNGF
ncbi:hypothetical protein DFH11DRAFT_1740709 [Phellopilus nigrolimitatus]|nr:hypothetical protein DFH11DRAFT_1740709 [Phellopilus nigrolimitatus]